MSKRGGPALLFENVRGQTIPVLINAFAGEPCFGHVHLTHCERSEVASLAARRL